MTNQDQVALYGGIEPVEPGNYRTVEADKWVPFDADKANDKQMVVDLLQATVVELLDLYHATKQAHWNVRGPLFFPLHENFDAFSTIQLDYADRVAERALQIGAPIDGRTKTVAQTARLGDFPEGFLTGWQALTMLTERIYQVAVRIRTRTGQLSEVDETTSNVFQDLSYALDKQVWQLRVHLQ